MIRAAAPYDVPQLLGLIHGLAAHHGDASSVTETDLVRDLFGPIPWLHILVEDAGTLRGYAALTQLARLQYGQRGMDLHHLYVRTDSRSAGLGKALLHASVNFARALHCSYLTVSALSDNVEAQAFYRKQGFTLAPVSGVRFAIDLAGKS
jgi:ribosomal protein S18 acetylase RimI-like enzyme